MNTVIQSRNWTIDLLKLIAAYFIVFIHVPFYGELGVVVTNIARFAVPVFFIVSGYFCYGNDAAKIRSKQIHIVHIFIFASLLYNVCNIAMNALDSGLQGIVVYLNRFIDIKELIEFVLFNDTISATRLWFLPALIYTYGIQRLVIKRELDAKRILVISVVLLVINLFCSEFLLIFGKEIPVHFTRNFLITGYPLFGIGLCLRDYKDKVGNISIKVLAACVLFGLTYALVSALLLVPTELSLGTVLIAVSAFVIAMKNTDINYSNGWKRLFQCSLGIYILHRPITTVINILGAGLGIGNEVMFSGYVLPIFVCVFTTMCVLFINYLIDAMHKKNRNMSS